MSTSSSTFRYSYSPFSRLSEADREQVAEISVTVGNTYKQGCIYFAICNNRLKIEALEGAIEESLAPKGITVSRVVLAERRGSDAPAHHTVYILDPIAHLSEKVEAAPKLFFIYGLPELIRAQTDCDHSKVAPVSQLLNYRRELFRDHALCALFWLDTETVPYLMQKAPDFWAFRSGTAKFADALESRGPRMQPTWQDMDALVSEPWSGDLEEKQAYLALYRQKSPPDENAVANLLVEIGYLRASQQNFQAAFEDLYEAKEIFERLRLKDKTRDVKVALAQAFEGVGRPDKAEAYFQEAIAIDSELHNNRNLAADYNNLALIYRSRGELDEAERTLRRAIEIAEDLPDEPNVAVTYFNLSLIYQDRGRLEEAEKWLRRAMEINQRLGDERRLAVDYSNLSQIYRERGRLEEAEKWSRQAMEINQRFGEEERLAVDYNNLSQIYLDRGQCDEAESWLRRAIAMLEPKGPPQALETLNANLRALRESRQAQTP